MSLDLEVGRGARAKAILESDLYREAVAKVQADIFDCFAKTDPANLEELRIQRIRLKCLADINRELATVMNTGKLAEAEIKQKQGLAQRMKERAAKGIRAVF